MDVNGIPNFLGPWTMFVVVFIISTIVVAVFKKWLWSRIRRWAVKDPHGWRARALQELDLPAKLLVIGMAVSLAEDFIPVSFRHMRLFDVGLRVYFIAVSLVVLNRVSRVLVSGHSYFSRFSVGSRQLIQIVVSVFVYLVGGLIILDSLGISITPLLASLGVGSVAVALALQDTLSNFFSGIYVLADHPINIGDYIRLDDGNGMEGYVVHIGWRSTRIQQLSSNVVVVPNSKIASSRLINYNLPTPEVAISVNVGVSYDADLPTVERVAIEVARDVLKRTAGAVADYEPWAHFNSFDDSSIGMSVGLRAKTFVDQYTLKHEMVKALHARFKAEGIDIPYPQRVIHNA